MTKSNLMEIFCLEGMLLDKTKITEKCIYLNVRSPRRFALCPSCASATKRVHRVCIRTLNHSLFNYQLIKLKLKVRNFYCKNCGRYFREVFPGVDQRKSTEFFRQNIIPKIRDRSFRAVAKEHGLSVSSLMRCTLNVMREIKIIWPVGRFKLGIDEHSFSGHDLMITITDLTNHKLLAILPNDLKSTLRTFLREIPLNIKQNIICAATDMRRMYYDVAQAELNQLPVVVDKFHVISFFNYHLGEFRTLFTSSRYPLPKKLLEKNKEELTLKEQGIILEIFKRFPSIGELWRLKEFVRRFYLIKDKKKAEAAFQVLLSGLEFDPRSRWQSIYKTLRTWRREILNYFEYRITNAYTEGVHTRIKLLKRISYGFRNKTNYIAKMTLAFLPITILHHALLCSPSLT